MGSRSDDWIYWTPLLTVKVDYKSSHIELLLNDACIANLYEESLTVICISDWSLVSRIESECESYITTDGHSASLSWCQAPIWGLRPDFYYCQTVAGLLMWAALSDGRTGLTFTIAAGPRQRSHSGVRVPWDSRPGLRFETSFFVASYDSQGYGGDIRPRLHTG
jgi:hypothetical protein